MKKTLKYIYEALGKTESLRILKLCTSKSLRNYAEQSFELNSTVKMKEGEKWVGFYKVIGYTGGNVILESGRNIIKAPRHLLQKVVLDNENENTNFSNDVEDTKHKNCLFSTDFETDTILDILHIDTIKNHLSKVM